LLVELKTFEAHGSQRLFVDAYAPSTLCGRNWVRGNRHLSLFYFETHPAGGNPMFCDPGAKC
jgi:hypothetical protein